MYIVNCVLMMNRIFDSFRKINIVQVEQFWKKKENVRCQKCNTKNDLKSAYKQNFAILIKVSSQIIPQRRSGLSREKPHFIPERSPGI